MVQWLQAMLTLHGARTEAAVFSSALEKLRPSPPEDTLAEDHATSLSEEERRTVFVIAGAMDAAARRRVLARLESTDDGWLRWTVATTDMDASEAERARHELEHSGAVLMLGTPRARDLHVERVIARAAERKMPCIVLARPEELPTASPNGAHVVRDIRRDRDKTARALVSELRRALGASPLPRFRPASPAVLRAFPLLLVICAAAVHYFGRTVVAPPVSVVAIVVSERTDVDFPSQPAFSSRPIPLQRVAELIDRIVERAPRAVAVAVDLSASERGMESVQALAQSLRAARDAGVRVVLPDGAAPALIEAAGGHSSTATAALDSGSPWIGSPFVGVPLGETHPLSFQLVGARPSAFADSALVPWPWQSVDPVLAIPAAVVLGRACPDLSERWVVVGGIFRSPDGHVRGAQKILHGPGTLLEVSTAEAHALVAGFAAGAGLRWQVPCWPFIAAALAIQVGANPLRRPRTAALGSGIFALCCLLLAVATHYAPPALPLLVLAAVHWTRRRFFW